MKRNFISVVVIILSVFVSQAQNDTNDFTLAPQIGVNFSTYGTDANGVSYDARISVTGGVIGDYYINNRWSVRSGFIVDGMGAEDSFNITDKLNYLTIPLNANWHFGKQRNWYLNFGPALAFLMNAESDFPDGSSEDVKEFVKSTDIGLALGIGYKFNINENFQLAVDYQGYGGFLDVVEDGVLPYSIKNSRSSFNIGGVFKI